MARSVEEFVANVASVDEPAPAGASVAALTGATSAALVALVWGIRERRQPGQLADELHQAEGLQARLLALVDEDVAAFSAYLEAKRASRLARAESGSAQAGASDLQGAVGRVVQTPLAIAAACGEVVPFAVANDGNIFGAIAVKVQGPGGI